MRLKAAYIRFYKSFNFDYLRKFNRSAKRYPWEQVGDLWYPYVKVSIEERTTTVVGANESGKTHLLTAIEKGLSGTGTERDDFCRYSRFFSVEMGEMRWPEYGFQWTDLTDLDKEALRTVSVEISGSDTFYLFRTEREKLTVYVPTAKGYREHNLDDASSLLAALPQVFRLQENIALPQSVPIRFLAGKKEDHGLARLSRKQRSLLLDGVWNHEGLFESKEKVAQAAETLARDFGPLIRPSGSTDDSRTKSLKRTAEMNLAFDLIRKIARVDAKALNELSAALEDGRDAFANSIIAKINEALQTQLNFPHWWIQDSTFRLLVAPRDHDLVFTVRDRTEKEYAFSERSSGLRYFLSYYIQYLAHDRSGTRREILVMDEPDAYLSNQGQQDLLKIFDAFTSSPDPEKIFPIQLIYVTHSPFLIDKNHAERIRVLEKGAGTEGTRVVRDASRNHYEPLRSAFGSFVGETTFIGNCNLVLEGLADQILLTGGAAFLRGRGRAEIEILDLNHLTLVPAGGASHVPYLVYLARGRDIEKPAVIVFLDSDKAGNDARKVLERSGGARGKQILETRNILQIGEIVDAKCPTESAPVETEDLIPLEICSRAVAHYLRDLDFVATEDLGKVTTKLIREFCVAGSPVFDAVSSVVAKEHVGIHLDKVGFARSVIAVISTRPTDNDKVLSGALSTFEKNMLLLFRRLASIQRVTEREMTTDRVSDLINRAKDTFLQDHAVSAKAEEVLVLLESMESFLDNSSEADQVRVELHRLRRDYRIEEALTKPISDFEKFIGELERVQYLGRLTTQADTLQEAALSAGTEGSATSRKKGSAAPRKRGSATSRKRGSAASRKNGSTGRSEKSSTPDEPPRSSPLETD